MVPTLPARVPTLRQLKQVCRGAIPKPHFLIGLKEERAQEDSWMAVPRVTLPLPALETWDTLSPEERDERIAAILGWTTRDSYGRLPQFTSEPGWIRHLVSFARVQQFPDIHFENFKIRLFQQILARHHRTPIVGVACDADLFLDATPAEVSYALYATYGPLEGRLPRGGCWYVTPNAGKGRTNATAL